MHRLPLPLVSFVSGCVLFAVAAWTGLWLMQLAENAPAFWPVNGLLVVLILSLGLRQAGWVLAGAAVGGVLLQTVVGAGAMGLALTASDLLEVVFVVYAAHRLRLPGSGLESIFNVTVLVAILSTGAILSALSASATLAWYRDVPIGDTFPVLWRLNAASAAIILAPFFAWVKPGRMDQFRRALRRSEWPLVLEFLAIVAVAAGAILVMRDTGVSMISFFTAPLLWCAIRFGPPATASLGSAISLAIILLIVAGEWPRAYNNTSIAWQLQRTELALSLNAIPPLFVAAALAGLRKAARDLKRSQERLRYALAGSSEGVWDWNINTDETYFSDGWYAILGYQRHELKEVVDTWGALRHPDDTAETARRLNDHLEGRSPRYSVEQRLRHRDGHWVWVLDRGGVVERDAEGNPTRAVGTLLDISRRRARQEELDRRAHHDALTGLANRASLTESFQRWNEEKRSFCFLLIDLDDFKPINDLYGHQFGDHALLAIADRLRACLGKRDIAARIGGDEFALLIESRLGEAEQTAQRLIARISEPIGFADAVVSTGASIGIAQVAGGNPDFEGAYRRADIALYDAKASGGSSYRIADQQQRADHPRGDQAVSALLAVAGVEPADDACQDRENAAEHGSG
ncbi:sensor domain-containing diguanylate cyclase [Kaistia sp. 32K]|uniref:sensor domain-containing diguanylate cyclase n=1 Tax=Kaistia sp. 32K TaxID=2795690 RepID=UPI001914DB6B|nr:sensor domain-containing diguanylate cyclase [Kaistia sp. 32K]